MIPEITKADYEEIIYLFSDQPAEEIRKAKEAKENSICRRCGKNVFADPKDYYMVTDEIWSVVNGGMDGHLCIGCLEEKLGRPIQESDISNCPLNAFVNPYTAKFFTDNTPQQ